MLFPVVGLQQQTQLAIVAQCGCLFACVVLQFAQQRFVQSVQHVDEWSAGNGSRRGGAKGQSLASWSHRASHHIYQIHHVALAVGVGTAAQLIPVYQLGKRSILGFSTSRQRHNHRIAHAVVLRFPSDLLLGDVESMAIVDT